MLLRRHLVLVRRKLVQYRQQDTLFCVIQIGDVNGSVQLVKRRFLLVGNIVGDLSDLAAQLVHFTGGSFDFSAHMADGGLLLFAKRLVSRHSIRYTLFVVFFAHAIYPLS